MAQPVLGLLFGGNSNEYEVSLASAVRMAQALASERIPHRLLGMDRAGNLFLYTGPLGRIERDDWLTDLTHLSPSFFVRGGAFLPDGEGFLPLSGALLATHGGMTEDGRLQGTLDFLGIPYAGSGCESCAVTMNKALTKTVLRAAGIPVADGLTAEDEPDEAVARVEAALAYPLFVKPARSGSSIGCGIARNRDELFARLSDARTVDPLVLVEPLIAGRELEVAILENGDGSLAVSPPGELLYDSPFYDYGTKYDGAGAGMAIPADLPPGLTDRIRGFAAAAYTALGCRHYARVDFFLPDGGEPIVNEVNALPGMTCKSMFPALADAMGVPFPALIRRLVAFATKTPYDRGL